MQQSRWSDYTEYGTPRDLATSKTIGGPLGYGWLGQKQRSATDATAGLTLMGARLYNPTRGLFTSIDPVEGGSDSAYAYPTDPINQADATGLWWSRKTWKRKLNRAANFTSKWSRRIGYIPMCAVCSGVSAGLGFASAGMYAGAGRRRKALRQFAGTAVTTVMGGARSFRSAGSYARRIKVGHVRGSYRATKRYLRAGGVAGHVARGARAQGRGRLYRGYVHATWYGLGQGVGSRF